MDNILSYLKWRGDLTFNESSFNEVDNLVLCAFTYLRLNEVLKREDVISIKEFYSKYKIDDNIFEKNQNNLLTMMSKSKRFKEILIARYVNEISEKQEKQFSAITFLLPNNQLFVAFKGTDETITGWKENFNMSYMNIVPAQKSAIKYLEEILNHTNKKVLVGGHSKGGNLAMYATIFCDSKLKDKILKIYNNDGPGLNNQVLNEKKCQEIKEKIITFIPKSSIIGNFFTNDTKIILIESSGLGILQHDLYSWLIDKDKFSYAKEIDTKTKELSNFLNETINKIPQKQKEKIINFIYDIMISLNIYDIELIGKNLLNNLPIINKYNFNLEDLKILKEIIPIIIKILKI